MTVRFLFLLVVAALVAFDAKTFAIEMTTTDNEQLAFLTCGASKRDSDGDGLLDRAEKKLGTDPRNADTDGDGLSDGAEVNQYKTDPLQADTDGDGLSDGAEVNTYHTNPLDKDTDDDGLEDGAEVGLDTPGTIDVLKAVHTDPAKADTDGDGLNDGDEVNNRKTDPTKADTDGDTLSDGAEVNTHKTDPLVTDTDKGSVDDGKEVAAKTNPLDGSDDVPKIIIPEVGKSITLEGIVFDVSKATIKPESEEIMTRAYNTLKQNPDLEVRIEGHTDNSGKRATNMRLSEDRAKAVKDWLVAKGIDGKRISTKGYGPDKPLAANDTPENKQKNRRIEFARTK
ncbi:OmpA family protein [candidate division KSB1 bacterium]|nr:OmpA family protein [candidate division KSB1 bacterium]